MRERTGNGEDENRRREGVREGRDEGERERGK